MKTWKTHMTELGVPWRLWDYSLECEVVILSFLARGGDGIPGLDKIVDEKVNITEYLDFGFWERVWFHDKDKEPPTLGRWLGVAHHIGSAIC